MRRRSVLGELILRERSCLAAIVTLAGHRTSTPLNSARTRRALNPFGGFTTPRQGCRILFESNLNLWKLTELALVMFTSRGRA